MQTGVFIAAAAPNKCSLGTTNRLTQMVVAVQCIVAPAVAASLFVFSLANDIMGVTLHILCC